ncbi:phosphoglycerate mutase family protein [Paenibacillus taichungensis]|uniref:histidine phosphatase family protein n=1 Tax=Paenibacillus taichungensis TaxID=484184 RepID=UPI002DBDC3C5|nr:histidine phosphatase family protein [Paenibacillus taichungensis]MEC0111353.1 phosphoglycerate mutase family protein [Paenibacillus taichungensis]MEC0198912.1 phosphoglycerate mutase family protein [Paenibacillus taichungensis]
MKKNLIFSLLMIMMVFNLAACVSSNQNASGNSDEDNQVAEEQKEPGKVTIYLVRHGKTILNNTDRAQGWADGPLIPEGEELIKNVGKGLSAIPFTAAYSSDSGRAIQTANLILGANQTEAKNLELIQKQGIREGYFGSYEGEKNEVMWGDAAKHLGFESQEELLASGGNIIEKIMSAVSEIDPSGEAESYENLNERAFSEFKLIADEAYQNGGGDVLVVSHGITMGTILAQIDPNKVPAAGFANGSVTKLEYDGKYWKVLEVNELKYVEEGKSK